MVTIVFATVLGHYFNCQSSALLICRARKFENSASGCSPWAPIAHNIGLIFAQGRNSTDYNKGVEENPQLHSLG